MQTSDRTTQPTPARPPVPTPAASGRTRLTRLRLRRPHVIPPSIRPAVVGVPVATILLIVLGIVASLSPFTVHLSTPIWTVGLVVLGGQVVWRTIVQAISGHFATDVVATMAIITALVLGQPLPGLIVVLMQTGGEALEAYARGRASRAVRALEDAAPRRAHRVAGGE